MSITSIIEIAVFSVSPSNTMPRKVGQVFRVLIDKKEEPYYVGRTEYDSPEVDGEVLIADSHKLRVGNFYDVKITDSQAFDLFGEVV